MPSVTYTNHQQFFPQDLGDLNVCKFVSSVVVLSAAADTVVDFTPATGCVLSVGSGIPLSCGYEIVDATSGSVVDYGATVSQNAPNLAFGTPGQWSLRLVVPPVAGAPSIKVNAYVTFFPVNSP